MVTLHRVSPVRAGEIDSVRVGPDGRFRFSLPTVPSASVRNEVYFASVRHDGVLYFGELVGEAAQLDSLYLITVHDTATVPEGGQDFLLGVRNLILEVDEEGRWVATDLIQLVNEGDRTWVPNEGRPIWRYPLPDGASDLQLGQGDLDEETVSFVDGEVRVSAPIPPGERLYVLRYTLEALETRIPLPGRTASFQLLIREPAPPLAVEGLVPEAPVQIEPGSTYRLYSGESLTDASVSISEGAEPGGLPLTWITVGLGLLLTGVALFALSRQGPVAPGAEAGAGAGGGGAGSRSGPDSAPRSAPPAAAPVLDAVRRRGELLAEIARLDEDFEAGPGDETSREQWEARRGPLIGELRSLRG